MKTLLLVFAIGAVAVAAFGGSEDKFIKKYAMMKVSSVFYEHTVRRESNFKEYL